MHLVHRKTCRVCGSTALTPVINLGDQYLQGSFVKPGKEEPPLRKIPLTLVRCDPTKDEHACGLLQMEHTVPPEVLYSAYWYRSGTNQTMQNHLRGIAEAASGLVQKSYARVLDIGCNDGTLLKCYSKDYLKFGVDPSDVAQEVGGDITVVQDIFPSKELTKVSKGEKFDIITAIAMFYDLEDPVSFCREIKKVLADDGLWIFEMSYMPSMLKMNSYDTICFKPDELILGANKPISELKAGDRVIGENGQITQVVRTFSRQYTGEMVSIKPMYLSPIVATPEHPIKIVRKEWLRFDCGQMRPNDPDFTIEWADAKTVKVGDFVVVPKLAVHETPTSIDMTPYRMSSAKGFNGSGLAEFPLNEDTAWVLGLYVAEGHTNGRNVVFTLHQKETELQDKLLEVVTSLGYKLRKYLPTHRATKAISLVWSCSALAFALPEWVGKGAKNKRIPDFIMHAPNNIRCAFLKGLFDGDGCILGNKVQLHSVSWTLINQVQLLAASMGAMLGITYSKPYETVIKATGCPVHSGDSWMLRGASPELAKILGFEHYGSSHYQVLDKGDFILVPVQRTSVEEYNGEVCNIETECHTYLVSNAVVHNCHEHLEYYSLAVIEYILKQADLKVVDAELNDINGGSIRCYATHIDSFKFKNQDAHDRVRLLRQSEFDEELDTDKPYKNFQDRINVHKEQLTSLLKNLKKEGKKIHIYGASTKGNTILQWCGIDNRIIDVAAERNPDKYGAYTLGTDIPIVSEADSRAMKPDYYLVLPWHFKEEFLKREEETLKAGVGMIFPLPTVDIIKS